MQQTRIGILATIAALVGTSRSMPAQETTKLLYAGSELAPEMRVPVGRSRVRQGSKHRNRMTAVRRRRNEIAKASRKRNR